MNKRIIEEETEPTEAEAYKWRVVMTGEKNDAYLLAAWNKEENDYYEISWHDLPYIVMDEPVRIFYDQGLYADSWDNVKKNILIRAREYTPKTLVKQ